MADKKAKLNIANFELSPRIFWAAVAFCILLKLVLSSFQLIQIFPENAPIDDELMLNAAKSIRNGNWLGEYNWLTISKHMFFSVWLCFLNILHIPYVIGGQLLYCACCAVMTCALSPIFHKRIQSFIIFFVLWFSPYSFASFTLRVYRDNIFPSLCLLFFAGMLGLCLRANRGLKRSVPFAAAAGFGLGLALITREDGIWLLPFAVCASAFYILFFICKKSDAKQKLCGLYSIVCSLLICISCVGIYSFMNYLYYGRFCVSDFTSPEFSAVISAFKRADTDVPHKRILICSDTHKKIYSAVPDAAKLGELLETPKYMNGYGDIELGEYTSGGFCWALRRAAYDSGFAPDAQSAKLFYEKLASDINAACDSGQIESRDGSLSLGGAFTVPFDRSYIAPTMSEIGRSLRVLLLFEQTSAMAPLSYSTPKQALESEIFTFTKSSKTAIANTALPYYTSAERAAGICFSIISWCYRLLIFPALFLGLKFIFSCIVNSANELRKKRFTVNGLFSILLLGLLCSILLRVSIVSYTEATNYLIGTYLLYLSSAGPLILLIASLGTARLFADVTNAEKCD
ncbi:MAG: hypothetical protein RSD19_04505 [Oscillospiraceae bacterium]